MKTVLVFALLCLLVAACAPAASTAEPFVEPEILSEGLIPMLTVPEGAEPFGGGGGGSDNSMGTAVYFYSDLSVEEVHQHYFDQLEAAGWRFMSEQDAEAGMTSFWEFIDKDGSPWAAKLDVVFGHVDYPDAYEVTVSIVLPQ